MNRFWLVGVVCLSLHCVQAGQFTVNVGFGNEMSLDNGNQHAEPFAKALYVLVRHLIDPASCADIYTHTQGGIYDEPQESNSANKKIVAKKLSPRDADQLARRLLSSPDTKQIFQHGHRMGLSEQLIVT